MIQIQMVIFYLFLLEFQCFFLTVSVIPCDFSEKSDIDSSMGRKTPRIEASMMGNGPITLPTEAMYCTSPARRPHPQHTILAGNSPEAIKVRRAAMVLQAPTRV